jgi:hypothetical protein
VVLTPLAAPSILGLYGFMGATLIVAANLAGWYGTTRAPEFLFPFALAFGGIAQFLAGMGRTGHATVSRLRCTGRGARSGSATACCGGSPPRARTRSPA